MIADDGTSSAHLIVDRDGAPHVFYRSFDEQYPWRHLAIANGRWSREDDFVAPEIHVASAFADAGADPFAAVQLPQAAIALKQGFGRLIRRRDDRGIVAVLDPRILSRRYGRTFLDSLPAGLPRTSALEQVRRWWTAGAPGAMVAS